MSDNFGHHLVRNRQRLTPENSQRSVNKLALNFDELNDQVIILRQVDICADAPSAPFLDWSKCEKAEIAVQIKNIEGLSEGSVTIKASTLQKIHPALLPRQLEAEFLFPISLKAVVLQLQAHLRHNCEEGLKPAGPDFDTSIAQVAREDEGFFKLARMDGPKEISADESTQTKPQTKERLLTPADRPTFPMARMKSARHEIDLRKIESDGPNICAILKNPPRRAGLEQLQEIFLTEEQLDVGQVADLLAAFPKVLSAMVMLGDGTVLGGRIPDAYHLETALVAPALMRTVQEFNRKLRSDEISAFTLLGDRPVTFFAEGNVCVLIAHEGRGLLPGVRQRIGAVARALDAFCAK